MKGTTYMSREAKVKLLEQFFAVADNPEAKELLELTLTKDSKDHIPLPVVDLGTWGEFEQNMGINFLFEAIDMSTKNTYSDLFKDDTKFMLLFRDHLQRLASTFCFSSQEMKDIKIPDSKSTEEHIHKYGMKFVDLIRKKAMTGGDFNLVWPDDPKNDEAPFINPEVYNDEIEGAREEVLAYEEAVSALFCVICISIMSPITDEQKTLMGL